MALLSVVPRSDFASHEFDSRVRVIGSLPVVHDLDQLRCNVACEGFLPVILLNVHCLSKVQSVDPEPVDFVARHYEALAKLCTLPGKRPSIDSPLD
jgi:hypothetical protein